MIQNFNKYIHRAGAALFLVLASCCGGDGPALPGTVEGEWMPLRVAGASTGAGIAVQTRDGGNRTELTSGSIGMFLKEDGASGYTALANLRFTYATPYWQADEQILLGGQTATLAACYPYAAGRVNPVVLHSRQYSDAEDFHYVNFRANNETPAIRLDLSRVYSRLVFNFKANAGYVGAGKVTAIRLEGDGIVPAATLDMLDFSVHDTGKSVRDVLVPTTGLEVAEIDGLTTQFTAAVAGTADCLMIPHGLQGDITLTATVDGRKMTGKVTAAQLCGETGILAEGVKYEVNITVNQLEGLEIGTIKTTDWDSRPAWSEDVTLEPSALVINVPAYAINLSNPSAPCSEQDRNDLAELSWAGGNLNSSDNTGSYVWAATQTDYGYYYTFMSTYTGDTSTNNTDPCTKLDPNLYGTGWRTPSKNELEKLSRCTDKQLVSNNGVMGMWFMNNPNGVFLPAAGARDNTIGSGTGPAGSAGTRGFYWSSGAGSSSYGYSMDFLSGKAYIYANSYRTDGYSVRCVKGEKQ